MSTRRATKVPVSQVPHIPKGVRIQLPLSRMHSAFVNTNANSEICTFAGMGGLTKQPENEYARMQLLAGDRYLASVYLCWAAAEGKLSTCRDLILRHGVNVNIRQQEPSNVTPLHCAAEHGRVDVALFLLEKGAELEAVDNRNCTPLVLAAWWGHANVVRVLLNKHASTNAVNQRASSPLHIAAFYGRPEVVTELLNAHAEVNAVDQFGRTPLHLAARAGHALVVTVLLTGGAKVDKGDKYHATPLFYAVANKHEDVEWALREAGAEVEDLDQDSV